MFLKRMKGEAMRGKGSGDAKGTRGSGAAAGVVGFSPKTGDYIMMVRREYVGVFRNGMKNMELSGMRIR